MEIRAQVCQHSFRLGDRVRLSQLGKQRTRRPTSEVGTIVGLVNHTTGSVRILFDGLRTAKSLHWTYVEPLGELVE